MAKVSMALREDNNSVFITLEDGEIIEAVVGNNVAHEVMRLTPDQIPDYVRERIALLLLTPVNAMDFVKGVGRRLNDRFLIIRITYEEYKQLRSAQ